MFAAFCGASYGVATSSGTSALHLALLALGIQPGDEVIVPALTFIATANAVQYVGATPVIVDSERTTWNIDPACVEAAITPRTKALIPVHLYGHPAAMAELLCIADRHGLAVVEDAAQAHGARINGRRVGALGNAGCFSFFGNKIISTGEGGMLVTNDVRIFERARLLRDHGMSPTRKYWHEALGYNYRMTNIQAAIGVAQLERVEETLQAKRTIAREYNRLLKAVHGVTIPPDAPDAESVYWLYSVLVNERAFGMSRDDVMAALHSEGIETRPFFPPIHTQPIYATGQSLPVSEDLAATGLNLPSAPNLRQEDAQRVARALSRLAAPRS
jgi:perosamine synthetase